MCARDQLIRLIDEGSLDSSEVLKNLLVNYLCLDDANDFAESEYSDMLSDEND